MPDTPPMLVSCSGRTSTGKVRQNNEDALWAGYVGDPAVKAGDRDASGKATWPGFLLAVADGMGGALAGEVASRLAVESLAEEVGRRVGKPAPEGPSLAEVGKQSVLAANERIRAEGDAHRDRHGMGTTLTAAWVVGTTAEIFQVGDSRAYLWRDGRIEQLTKDQSLVSKLVEDGILSEEEAERVAGRHIILQALGSEEALEVAHRSVALKPGDVLMLCTDGLSGLVRTSGMEGVLKKRDALPEQCRKLIELAEAEGGTDNITVLLAKVQSGP
jgi:protein phosphatase